MSRILVTGIEGFAGGHLARHLASTGHSVVGLHWADAPVGLPGELHKGDVCDFDGTRALLEKTRPDGIIHLAGISSVALSEAHQMTTYEVNALGTLKLLEAVRQLGLNCRIVLISSADVYGRSNVGRPLTEDLPSLPLSPYALSKHMTGEAGRFYHRAFGLDTIVLRPFSHTGPGQTRTFVFPKVANAIAEIERRFRALRPGTQPAYVDVESAQQASRLLTVALVGMVILVGLIGFLIVNIFYFFDHTWVRPVVLSPTHQKVWPTIENTLTTKDYEVLLFDEV